VVEIDRLLKRKRDIIVDNHDGSIELLRPNLHSVERTSDALRSHLAGHPQSYNTHTTSSYYPRYTTSRSSYPQPPAYPTRSRTPYQSGSKAGLTINTGLTGLVHLHPTPLQLRPTLLQPPSMLGPLFRLNMVSSFASNSILHPCNPLRSDPLLHSDPLVHSH